MSLHADHLKGAGLALIFALPMLAPADTAAVFSFTHLFDVPGARVCYYQRGDDERRIALAREHYQSEAEIACPQEIIYR